jgi:hypothetical protein
MGGKLDLNAVLQEWHQSESKALDWDMCILISVF